MEVRVVRNDELMHYGVLGMKWGVRRYQNKDGRLTDEGKKRLVERSSTKDTSDIEKSYMAERSKLKDSDYVDRSRLGAKYYRQYAKTLLKDLKLEANDAAIADGVRALEKASFKRELDSNPEVSALVKSGYKLDYDSYDCTLSKKIDGVDVEISITERKDFLGHVVDKPSEVVSIAESFVKEKMSSASNSMAKMAYEEYKPYLVDENGEMGKISEREFASRIEPYYVRISKNGRDNKYGCEVGYDDDGMLGGHSIDIGYNITDDKTSYVSMNG